MAEQPFNPNDHVMQIKNRNGSSDYLPVQWRLVWFREQCPEGTITTELVHLDLDRETEEEAYAWNAETRRSEKIIKRANGFCIFKATVTDGRGGSATGHKSEKAASFPDYAEKAETGSIGRALAALGYGTQFAPELDEQHRIADAPVDRNTPSTDMKPRSQNDKPPQDATDSLATEQQLSSIRKLCQHLGKPEPEDAGTMTYLKAKELIIHLSHEYNERRIRDRQDKTNQAKREEANAPLTGAQVQELRAMFAVTFGVDGKEVNQRFMRWLQQKFGGAVTVEGLTAANYTSIVALLDQEATAGKTAQEV